jgi:Mg/Co/Ni transporter MgtE
MTISTHHRQFARQHLPWLAIAPAAVLGLMTMASPSDDGPTICPVALLTGVACPGCGMSRAIAWIFRGDIERAVGYHPLAPLVVMIVVTAVLWALGRRLRGWRRPSTAVLNSGLVVLAALLMAVWIARLASGTLPPV